MNQYEKLAEAIVKQHADDYRAAKKKLAINPNNNSALYQLKRAESYFKSKSFERLTGLDSNLILQKLSNEAN